MSRSDLELKDGRVLPKDCLSATFSRSGGAGGQHVNKTESRVDLRLDLEEAREVLGDRDVERIRRALANRLDADGRLIAVKRGARVGPRRFLRTEEALVSRG